MQDLIAHIFWHAEHISTVHHHHGDHHTDKQIAVTSHDEEHKKGSPALKILEPVSAHLAVVINYFRQYTLIKKQRYALLFYDAYSTFLGNNDPPPEGY